MIYFVTGGSRGIGAAIVQEAVAAGHDVAFTYHTEEASARDVAQQAGELRPDAHVRYYHLDVSDSAAVERVGDQALEDFDTVQVVVNNAGIVRSNMAALMTDEEWHEVLNTNLSGAFYVARHFLPTMLSDGFGRIINVSSVVSSGMSGMANYAAAKAGLEGLTRVLAKEYGRKNITANCIVPGAVETGMTEGELSDRIRDFGSEFAPVPKGRLANPNEIARLVIFLASDTASYINGAAIPVTGGLDWLP